MEPLTIFHVEVQVDFVLIMKHYPLSFSGYKVSLLRAIVQLLENFFLCSNYLVWEAHKKLSCIILCIHRWPIAEVLAQQYKNKVNEDKVVYYLFISPSTHSLPFLFEARCD